MKFPIELKRDVAARIVHIAAPLLVVGMILSMGGILLVGGGQYQRLIPCGLAIILAIPSWLFTKRGKPLVGFVFLLISLCLVVITGAIVSGGVHSLAYTGTLVIITIFVAVFDVRGGIVFTIFAIILGGVSSLLIKYDILHRVDEPPTAFLFLFYIVLLALQFIFVLLPVRLMLQALTNSQQKSEKLKQAVTERKVAQDELQSILNKTPDIIYRLNAEGDITFVNEAVRKYGYNPEDLIGKSIMAFMHPDDRAVVEQRFSARQSGKKVASNMTVRLAMLKSELDQKTEKAEGKIYLPFQISNDDLYSDATTDPQTFVGIQGIARDVSRIQHFEQQVNQLAAVVEQAAEDIILADEKGIIQYVNPKFEEVTGYSPSEVIGKTPRIFENSRHDTAFYESMWKTIKDGKIWKGRIWNKIKDGRLILQDMTITPIFDASFKISGYAAVRRDITEEARLQKQLQQSQKMEAIGTLAGGIAHDFNNILFGIMGYTELALNEMQDAPLTRKKLERVLESAGRATDLVQQILSFSRSHKDEVKPISPVSITKEVLKLMRASLPTTIEIKQTIKSENFIMADPTNIHQVLMNLCTNAAQAMKQKGGVLFVSLHDVTLNPVDLAYRPGVLPGEYLKISVEDTGTGMTKDIQDRAFDPFFTTKEKGEGTGLGLATVHGIITGISGFIQLYSEPGQGTAIHVFLPTIARPSEVEDRPAKEPLKRGTERILFVDDEQMIIELAQDALTRYGYQVTSFLDSTTALTHFEKDPSAYDLVVTDITMPKMTGDVLVQRIHLKRPAIPVIMCTGFSEVIDKQKAKALGVDRFLYKPILMKELLRAIQSALDKTHNGATPTR